MIYTAEYIPVRVRLLTINLYGPDRKRCVRKEDYKCKIILIMRRQETQDVIRKRGRCK